MSLPEDLTADSSGTDPIIHPFEFSGTGSEYFRIWIVNLALTLLTFGIYGPFAKVRTKRWFYGHLQLAGHRFAYHAEPMKILYGRLLALGIIFLVSFGTTFYTPLAAFSGIIFALLIPEAIRRSLRFRARNASWRGVRFDFDGSYLNALILYTLLPLTIPFTLALSLPWVIYRQRLWHTEHHRYGRTWFDADFTVGEFYIVAARTVLTYFLVGLCLSLLGLGFLLIMPMVTAQLLTTLVLGVAAFIAVGVWIAGGQNLVFEGTSIAGNAFESDVNGLRLGWIYLSNALLVLFTLGLFLPWAAVRVARYRAECLSLVQHHDLDGFVAARVEEQNAIGEEVGDLLDLDIGF